MKSKLFNVIVFALLALTACDQKKSEETAETAEIKETTEMQESPDYAAFDKKVEVIRSFIKAHEDENMEAEQEFLADTLKWSPPYYNGNKWLGKSDYVAVLQNFHNDFENMKFEEGIMMADTLVNGMWSGSVFPKDQASMSPDAIRIYGTWKGKHTESGKDIGVKWFALAWINDAGKISEFTEYFDVHGLAAQIDEEK
jgi:hypothetical protein